LQALWLENRPQLAKKVIFRCQISLQANDFMLGQLLNQERIDCFAAMSGAAPAFAVVAKLWT